jgi:threonyl-tRNA synthetase
MIHRAPFGSMERFVAVLIEHTGGNFPLWLTPTQAIILPISDKYQEYAETLCEKLSQMDVRVSIDDRSEKTGRKIRDAEMQKIPYMIIVGEKEMNEQTLSVRCHGGEDLGSMTVDAFSNLIENKTKELLSKKP